MKFTEEELRDMFKSVGEGVTARLEVTLEGDKCNVSYAGTFPTLIKIVTHIVAATMVEQDEALPKERREECVHDMCEMVRDLPNDIMLESLKIKLEELVGQMKGDSDEQSDCDSD